MIVTEKYGSIWIGTSPEYPNIHSTGNCENQAYDLFNEMIDYLKGKTEELPCTTAK